VSIPLFVPVLALSVLLSFDNQLYNPEFGDDLAQWQLRPPALVESVSVLEPGTMRIERKDDERPRWRSVVQRREVLEGERFALRAEVRAEDTMADTMFGIAMHFYDADGNRIGDISEFGFHGLREWTPSICRGEAPPGAVSMTIGMHTRGIGSYEVRGMSLKRLPNASPPPGPEDKVTLTVTDEVTVDALIGFGAEDDGWFYNAQNANHGAGESDYELREARIEWMQPDWIRSFFWIGDWNPSLDLETFDWGTDNMRSQYRTLDLYQRIGARVTICHTEWGASSVWERPEAYARAVGELMEHLIVERGYSCIQDWTLTNEPNLFFVRQEEGGWETFKLLHTLVAAEFERRDLNLNIVGSDDGESLIWFDETVQNETLFERSGLYASHAYFSAASLPFLRDFYAERLERLRTRTPIKPFVMAEFGFMDERTQPPSLNPLMEEYRYAMLTHRAIIAGLNEGVAGFNIWCMHEVYYPGGGTPMNFGLWHFVDRDSKVRPVYHSLAAFSRHSAAGMQAYRCDSSHRDHVDAARVGDTLFWFNDGAHPQPIRVEGMHLGRVRVYTEITLAGDRETGVLVDITDNRFIAPARSFGFALPE